MATTYTGRLLTPTNFGVPSPIDLAVQLGRLPRFVGATREWPWTVLHHVLAMYRVAEEEHSVHGHHFYDGYALGILLHEADELATGDVPTTFKTDDLRARQKHVKGFVQQVYNRDSEEDRRVKSLDWCMMAAEMDVVGPPHVHEHSGMDIYAISMNRDRIARCEAWVSHYLTLYSDARYCGIPTGDMALEFLELLRRHGAPMHRFGMGA